MARTQRADGDDHRVTIMEIARMCGVSAQTVSRVINQRPDVSPETRAAVESAIRLVGFQPSAVARSLVQRRSYTLGVIAAGLRYFGVAQTLNGITEESEASGYALLLKEIASRSQVDLMAEIALLMAHRVEGIIFAAPDLGADLADVRARLPRASPPIVFLKSQPSAAFSTILIDNQAGGRLATEHLLSLGRRRIGHLAGPLTWHEARDRDAGWRAALRDAGVEAGPVVAGDWTSAGGVDAFEAMLEADPDLDAVFAANDQMALGVLSVAHRRGIVIPDDIALVGFDGLDEGAQFTPSLTTVRQPLQELGKLAVRELLAAGTRQGPERLAVRDLTLAPELIIRDSAPRGRRPDQPE
ncbi:MAG: LacI family DNA-binding transcriptional regulator [Candidatus Limnocylindrales bacterium]